MDIRSEQLAYWYLRLNGFLTIANFVVHPDRGLNQETDVDLLGVRFPYRHENLYRPMRDDNHFERVKDKPLIILAEVKTGRCGLNGPWTNPKRQNMLRVLRAIGAFTEADSNVVAQGLYDEGLFVSELYRVSLLCLGGEQNPEIAQRYPNISQILWPDILQFIHRRFRDYRLEKRSHSQWDPQGQDLWKAAERFDEETEFKRNVRVI